MRDLGRHPELPAAGLIGAWDQYAAEQRAAAGVYHPVVQHLADMSLRGLEKRGVLDSAVVTRCGVCLVAGSSEHDG